MSFNFENLNSHTRELMLDEVEIDNKSGNLFLSNRLSDSGKNLYPQLLRQSIKEGNEVTLADDLQRHNCFNSTEQRTTKNGVQIVRVPNNANEILADGEFNRFYIRALCRRAIEDNDKMQIYRAKIFANPRSESKMIIDKFVDPHELLKDLRKNIGINTALRVPPGPNSGLSVRIVK